MRYLFLRVYYYSFRYIETCLALLIMKTWHRWSKTVSSFENFAENRLTLQYLVSIPVKLEPPWGQDEIKSVSYLAELE